MPSSFYDLSANEQVLLAVIIAILLSDGLNAAELAVLGNFIESIGQNLLLIQSVISAIPSDASPVCPACTELRDLRTRLDALEARI